MLNDLQRQAAASAPQSRDYSAARPSAAPSHLSQPSSRPRHRHRRLTRPRTPADFELLTRMANMGSNFFSLNQFQTLCYRSISIVEKRQIIGRRCLFKWARRPIDTGTRTGNIVGSQLLERGRWNYVLIHGKSIITATCYFQGENIILYQKLFVNLKRYRS